MALVLPSVGILIVRSVTAIGSMVNVMDEKITKITGMDIHSEIKNFLNRM